MSKLKAFKLYAVFAWVDANSCVAGQVQCLAHPNSDIDLFSRHSPFCV